MRKTYRLELTLVEARLRIRDRYLVTAGFWFAMLLAQAPVAGQDSGPASVPPGSARSAESGPIAKEGGRRRWHSRRWRRRRKPPAARALPNRF